MRRFANLLILLTDTVSANFITQSEAHKVSVHFSPVRVNTVRIISLTWLTQCQQEADKLSAGRMTDTLSLFRECLVRAVSRRCQKEETHTLRQKDEQARRAGLAGTAAEMELHA